MIFVFQKYIETIILFQKKKKLWIRENILLLIHSSIPHHKWIIARLATTTLYCATMVINARAYTYTYI